MSERDQILALFERCVEIAIEESQEELEAQGHNASGDLINSFESNVSQRATLLMADILVNDYGIDLDTGIPAKKVPRPGQGARFTEFIANLEEWAGHIGIPYADRTGFVFAVHRKMMRQGIPTKGSYRFSKNGRRTGWISASIESAEEKIARALEDSPFVEIVLTRALTGSI